MQTQLALASLKDFTPAAKKKAPVQKKVIKHYPKRAPRKIQNGLIWHAPNSNFLAKRMSEREYSIAKDKSLEILVLGLEANDYKFQEAKNLLYKRQSILNLIKNQVLSRSDNEAYVSDKKSQAQAYIDSEIKSLKKDLETYLMVFNESEQRNTQVIKHAKKAKERLSYKSGLPSVNQVRPIWQRELRIERREVYVSKID